LIAIVPGVGAGQLRPTPGLRSESRQDSESAVNSSSQHAIRLVVLDWAGTTVDFGCFGPVVPFTRALARHGVEVGPEQVRGPMGINKKDHIRALLGLPGVADAWRRARGRDWDESDVERIYVDDYVPLQLEAIGDHGRLVPGLLEAVAELRARGLKVATTTGYFREAAAPVFEAATRGGYLRDVDVLPDEVPAGRPAPWMIFRAMEATGIYPPSAVVKVGDTPADMAEGRNAGAWCVGVVASSSMIGLDEGGWAALDGSRRRAIVADVGRRLRDAGAHDAIETLAELSRAVDDLGRRLRDGESPDASGRGRGRDA
jgi:phosphonoacetaldehyde hydrolase